MSSMFDLFEGVCIFGPKDHVVLQGHVPSFTIETPGGMVKYVFHPVFQEKRGVWLPKGCEFKKALARLCDLYSIQDYFIEDVDKEI
jgi:hypothetical protein